MLLSLILGLTHRLPCIKVKDNIIFGRDPDFPGTEHFCMPETTNYPFQGQDDPFKDAPLKATEKKIQDYGRAKLVDPTSPDSDIVYDSMEYEGHRFEFTRVSEYNTKGALF